MGGYKGGEIASNQAIQSDHLLSPAAILQSAPDMVFGSR